MPFPALVARAGVLSEARGASLRDLSTSIEGEAARLAARDRGLAVDVSRSEET
jgi:hypothetical protein